MATPAGIAFDAFGTLFDLEALRPRLGDETFEAFAARLVPYTWHLTAAGRFEPFPEVAKAALSDAGADPEAADTLEELPPFEDVAAGLSDLAAAGVPLAVLSNGTTEGIEALVSHAGLADRFTHLLAADRVERYKPAPELYALGPSAFDAAPADVLLVSGNEWDVAGAHWAGLRTAWVARGRSFSAFAGVEPDLAVQDLVELARTLQR
jgi:2-haloacid dehalogenase